VTDFTAISIYKAFLQQKTKRQDPDVRSAMNEQKKTKRQDPDVRSAMNEQKRSKRLDPEVSKKETSSMKAYQARAITKSFLLGECAKCHALRDESEKVARSQSTKLFYISIEFQYSEPPLVFYFRSGDTNTRLKNQSTTYCGGTILNFPRFLLRHAAAPTGGSLQFLGDDF
jgi:hypothetical protein